MGKANGRLVQTHGDQGRCGNSAVGGTSVEWDGQAVIVRAAALVAQLDRASDFESEGREFESLRARQFDN
jgi:hypothetical protein